jgi:hypothetical protein
MPRSDPDGRLPDAVVPATRDWQRVTFGPFARRAILSVAEALFTDDTLAIDEGAKARFDWLVLDADAMISNGSRQLRAGMRMSILLLELLPLFVVGRFARCSSLPLATRVLYLQRLEAGPITQLALLVVLWKSLLTILYFEHPEAAPHLGHDGRHERHLRVKNKRVLDVVSEVAS